MNKNLSTTLRYLFLASSIAFCASGIAQSGAPISSPPNPAVGTATEARIASLRTNSAPALTNAASSQIVLGFDQLAGYPLKLTEELALSTNRTAWADSQINAMIPESIRKLDGQRISVEGFMLPVAYEQEHLTEFMLVRDMPGCCFGSFPNPHEWVKGVVKNPKIKAELDHPVRVRGLFHVGAERHGGYLSSIYRLDADSVGD
jgi:hypothetical protein